MTLEAGLNEAAFLDSVRSFVDEEVAPFSRDWEEARAFPDDIWPKLGAAGLLSLTHSRENGGAGASCRVYCEAVREVAHGDPALAMNLAAINALCVGHLDKFGSPEQKSKYLRDVAQGRTKMAWGLTEPDAGSDARRVKTRATPIAGRPGYFALNGRKMFITNGGKADLMVILARTSDTELSALLMETNQPGFRLERRIHTVGVSASNTVEFSLNDAVGWHTACRFEDAIDLLYRGRLGIAAMALGLSERAHELAVAYSKEREQFNRRLADMQSVQNMIADSEVDLEATRLLIREGARKYDVGEPIIRASSIAKLFASETSNRVTNRAIQIHGGRGMMPEYHVEKLWRDAKLTEIGEGCSEIQRMVIAKQVLK